MAGDYVESFRSRNGLSRERVTAGAAEEFDGALRRLVARHCRDGIVRADFSVRAVWGAPSVATAPER